MTAFGVPSRLPPGWRAEDWLARRLHDDGGYVAVSEAAEAMGVTPEEVVQLAGEGALAVRHEGGVLRVRPAIVTRAVVVGSMQ